MRLKNHAVFELFRAASCRYYVSARILLPAFGRVSTGSNLGVVAPWLRLHASPDVQLTKNRYLSRILSIDPGETRCFIEIKIRCVRDPLMTILMGLSKVAEITQGVDFCIPA